MTVHGFNERQIAEALKRFVLAGGMDSTSSSQEEREKRTPNRKLWLFTPKTVISGASMTGDGDYIVGYGSAYVMELNYETKILEKLTDSYGDWVYKTVFNHRKEDIPDDSNLMFFGQQDWRGNYWVANVVDISSCVSVIEGQTLNDLPTKTTTTSAPYVLGIDSDGCLCKIPTKECP